MDGRHTDKDWWRGAVIYQIYPRSFLDTTGNGVGDLAGIISKLDYVASLGVDGIWLSPFFTSPMHDYGYDVADYCNVDPIFGTLQDFDALVARTHRLGLKIIIDQVYSHTSHQHEWFRESSNDKTNPKADWYVWAEAKEDGSPPNNWLSVFGGPAWSWETKRRQYYLHNFLREQPDLNFHNPDMQDSILDVTKFWLEHGVDGFRLDVANYYLHDEQLRDNPPSGTTSTTRPYDFQQHLYNRSQPENLAFVRKLRKTLDTHPGKMTVAEIFSAEPGKRSIDYVNAPDLLHTAYSFSYLQKNDLTAQGIRTPVDEWQDKQAWPSWSFSNHDVPRVLSRWTSDACTPEVAKLLNTILLCLRGTIFLYQGEELGLPQADVPFEKLRDPEAIRFWPETLGRDGCRTPMPWQMNKPHAGFSTTAPWLPVDERHLPLSVDVQKADEHSVLNTTRAFLDWRKKFPALITGDIEFHDTTEPLLVFDRINGDQKVQCIFNVSNQETDYIAPENLGGATSFSVNLAILSWRKYNRLPPFSGVITQV